MLKIHLLLSDKYEICYLEVNGKHLVPNFIDSLPESNQEKIFKLLEYTAKNGPPFNKRKFHKLRRKGRAIFEFKAVAERILCAFGGEKTMILSHGFSKGKKIENEIEKAQDLFNQYFGEKKK